MGRHIKANSEGRAVKPNSATKPSSVDPGAPLPVLGPLKPTPVYNSYWRFAAERQNVFFRRLEGLPPPWTQDPVIRAHKFTNAYRASDRVSQYLIRRVIYRADLPDDPVEVCLPHPAVQAVQQDRDLGDCWRSELGPLTHAAYSFKRYDQVLGRAMARGQSNLLGRLHHAVRRFAGA